MVLVGAGVLALVAAAVRAGWDAEVVVLLWCVPTMFMALRFAAVTRYPRLPSSPEPVVDRQGAIVWGEFALYLSASFACAALWKLEAPATAVSGQDWFTGVTLVMFLVDAHHGALTSRQRQGLNALIVNVLWGTWGFSQTTPLPAHVVLLVASAGSALAAWMLLRREKIATATVSPVSPVAG